jgi:hypothetical protein
MAVFVLDAHQQPLMPCAEKRARLLLQRQRAVVHHVIPFCIRLRDRRVEASTLQPVILKVDPGSRTTGLALARSKIASDGEGEGEVHHACRGAPPSRAPGPSGPRAPAPAERTASTMRLFMLPRERPTAAHPQTLPLARGNRVWVHLVAHAFPTGPRGVLAAP